MAYSKLFFGVLVLLAGACSNEAPTYFLAQIKWWLGEQQTLNTFNVGTTLLF